MSSNNTKHIVKYWRHSQPYSYCSMPGGRFDIDAVARNESGEYTLALDISKCECWRLTDWWGCRDCSNVQVKVSYHDSVRECKKKVREILAEEKREAK